MDLGAARNDQERESTYRFLNDEISSQQRVLIDIARALETKATLIAGFSATAVSFLLANSGGAIGRLGLAAYVAALATAVAVHWTGEVPDPGPDKLIRDIGKAAPDVAVAWVIALKANAYRRNERLFRHKAVLWRLSVGLLAAGLALSLWSAAVEGFR
jgi:hypothetical protein